MNRDIDTEVLLWPILAVILLLVGVLALALVRRRRRRRSVPSRLQACCAGVLSEFVIPDGGGGEVRFDYVLLTARGIVVLDVKDVSGNVFGSEGMQEWTVLAADRRYTFANPQTGLWDRVAAVKRLVPEVPVTGYIAFGSGASFTKGQPRGVVAMEDLLRELEAEARAQRVDNTTAFAPFWQRLVNDARRA